MANKPFDEDAYSKLGISKYAPWYKVLNVNKDSSFNYIGKKYNHLRHQYENSNDKLDEEILEILDLAYEDVIYQFNFKSDDEVKEDACEVLGVDSSASWFEILGVNINATEDEIKDIANSSKNRYNSEKLSPDDPEYLQRLYKAIQETILNAAEEGIEEISKPKGSSKLTATAKKEDKAYKGHKTKYYNEFVKIDELGGLNYLAKELQTKTTKEIAEELFNLSNDSLISQYCKFNNTTVKKIKSEYGESISKNEKTQKSKKYKTCPNCGKEVNAVRNHCPYCKYDFTYKPRTSNKKTSTKTKTKTKHAKTCPQCGQKFYSKNIKKCTKCRYDFELGNSPQKNDQVKCPICGKRFLKSGHHYSNYKECPHCRMKITPVNVNVDTKTRTYDVTQASDEKTEITNTPQLNKSKICPQCGKSVLKNAFICHHCGYDFNIQQSETQETKKQHLIKMGNEQQRKYSNSNSKPCPICGKSINKSNNSCFSCGHKFKNEKGFLRRLFSSKKYCPACNEMNEEHFNYCKRCGYNFNTESFGISEDTKSDMIKCSKCGTLNSNDSNFCEKCGKKLRN